MHQGTDIRATTIHHLFDSRAVRNSIDSISECSDRLSRGLHFLYNPWTSTGNSRRGSISPRSIRTRCEESWSCSSLCGMRKLRAVLHSVFVFCPPCPYGLSIRWTLPETGLSPTVQDGPRKHARQQKHGGQEQTRVLCWRAEPGEGKYDRYDLLDQGRGVEHALHLN